jgi:hypothetical protein
MISELDHGIRCDDHIGEVFPPRCADCDALTLQGASDLVIARLGFLPGSECGVHAGYPLPCAKCLRDEGEQS